MMTVMNVTVVDVSFTALVGLIDLVVTQDTAYSRPCSQCSTWKVETDKTRCTRSNKDSAFMHG